VKVLDIDHLLTALKLPPEFVLIAARRARQGGEPAMAAVGP
jgi:hypothetical protein